MKSKIIWLLLIITIIIALLATKKAIAPQHAQASTTATTTTVAPIASSTLEIKLTVQEQVQLEFPEGLMPSVAKCESGYRQFKDGEVLRGVVNSKDVGVFQINEDYWLKDSIKLGINIYETEGNIKMAHYIYNQSGTQPWSASRLCWNK